MTREQAIENLKEFIDTYITCHGEEDAVAVSLDNVDVEAFDMAIKALEQEPITKNDLGVDCISRDDVRNVMQELWGTSGELMDRLMALPSVTPQEPRKGHWIWEINETPSTPISPYELNYAGWFCSCCHEFPDDICEWDNPDEPPTYKFCPNCGSYNGGDNNGDE